MKVALLLGVLLSVFSATAARADDCNGGCNQYGCWQAGGGCNQYGCWNTPDGSCNQYGCDAHGTCSQYGCP